MKSKDERRNYKNKYVLYLGDNNIMKGVYPLDAAKMEDDILSFVVYDGKNTTTVTINDGTLNMLEEKLIHKKNLWKYAEYMI